MAALTVAQDAEHAIELANYSDLGLSGNTWTSDMERAKQIVRRMETSAVFINVLTA